jgi:hypothetical protein
MTALSIVQPMDMKFCVFNTGKQAAKSHTEGERPERCCRLSYSVLEVPLSADTVDGSGQVDKRYTEALGPI